MTFLQELKMNYKNEISDLLSAKGSSSICQNQGYITIKGHNRVELEFLTEMQLLQ